MGGGGNVKRRERAREIVARFLENYRELYIFLE